MYLSKQDYAATLDASGLHCPHPIINCKAMLASLDQGDILYMIATDQDAPCEISQLLKHSGNRLCEHRCIDGKHHFRIEKRNPRLRRRLSPRSIPTQIGILDYLHSGFRLLHRLFFPSPAAAQTIDGG